MLKKLINWFVFYTEKITDKIVLPGFYGISLWKVIKQFWIGITKGALGVRASAISYSFFLAMFPAIIFFFTLIPYIPIDNFQSELLTLLRNFMPIKIYEVIQTTIIDIATNKYGSLLSIGFFAALFFSTNGINMLIVAFNETVNSFETRNWIARRATALMLVVLLSILMTVGISLITFSERIISLLVQYGILHNKYTIYMILSGRWIITIALFYFAISFLYYLAPAKRGVFKFFNPGSTLATILGIFSSIGFSFYINNFSRYNTLYGSIGTLIIILLWIYVNSMVILVGFELNTSIQSAKNRYLT